MRVLEGVITRRLVIHYRIDSAVAARVVPPPLVPLDWRGAAVGSISLIRLEHLRPRGLHAILDFSIESMAHRIAVTSPRPDDVRAGVVLLRRDTGSRLIATLSRPLREGTQDVARFDVEEDERRLRLVVHTAHGVADFEVDARWGVAFTPTTCFATLEEARLFLEDCEDGYFSGTPGEIAMVRVRRPPWRVEAVCLDAVYAGFFANEDVFPKGSVEVDGAIAMRSDPHEWVAVEELPEVSQEPLPQPA